VCVSVCVRDRVSVCECFWKRERERDVKPNGKSIQIPEGFFLFSLSCHSLALTLSYSILQLKPKWKSLEKAKNGFDFFLKHSDFCFEWKSKLSKFICTFKNFYLLENNQAYQTLYIVHSKWSIYSQTMKNFFVITVTLIWLQTLM